jgi:hypothetical protein
MEWGRCNLGGQCVGLGKELFVSLLQVSKKGWMDFSEKADSLSSFVKQKMGASVPKSSEYRDLWDRVICPTIGNKYITIRCNLTNDIRATYKGK